MSDFIQMSHLLGSSSNEGALRPIRLNLAEAFSHEGEMALLQGELEKAISCFESAVKLDPKNSKLYLSQGLCLFDFATTHEDDKGLFLANKKLKMAAALDPHHFDIYRVWGSLLCLMGIQSKEVHYFQEAKEKLLHALSLAKSQESAVLAELQWDIGTVFSHLAQHSQEALDWHQSIQSFELAKSHQESLPADFWIDYGYAQLKLAGALNDVRVFVKAVQAFKKATGLDPKGKDGHYLLAKTMQKLYEHTHDEDHFAEANESFEMACQIESQSYQILSEWAQLLCYTGEKTHNPALLQSGIEKCQTALTFTPNDPLVTCILSECLAHLGHLTERLDLIHQAQHYLEQLGEDAEQSPLYHLAHGMCLRALGRYFEECDYDYQAIEKFQEGLSIDRTQHRLWHAMASSYAWLAKEEESEESMHLAIRFFHKAIDLHSCTYYLFDYATTLCQAGELLDQESYIAQSVGEFERLFQKQKNALYLHPQWLIKYGYALDLLGNFQEEAPLYEKAIDIFLHVLTLDPDAKDVHHYLALTLSHLGELTEENIQFERALHHYRQAFKQQEDNDTILLDWAVTLINLALHCPFNSEAELIYRDAEKKMETVLRLGNTQAYYHLACLYSLTFEFDKSIYYLEKAKSAKSCPSLEELLEDEWLEDVRATSAFHTFVQQLSQTQNFHDEL